MAALRSARVLMVSVLSAVLGLPPFAVAHCVATVCHRLRWHVNNFFEKTFLNPTNPQVNPHKKLLSHAARRAIVGVDTRIPGRNAAPTRSRLPHDRTRVSPCANARACLRTHARLPTYARLPTRAHTHAPMPARTYAPAHTRARPRARGSGEGQITTPPPATQRGPSDFLRTRNWSLLRNCYGTGERRNTLHRDSGGSAF